MIQQNPRLGKQAQPPVVRCAIYTRKSTEEGLEQEFNTLDAQRESAEAYIVSQQREGWTCVPDRYDDGGYTGGNMDRPALQQLVQDIRAGKIDCVIVYKVDRLSRSLLDFSRMMEVFDKHQVSFVSVTQQFNTATSMGRLVLHVLLSFAQFEREIISERTRDKIAAARRKGKWSGGRPLLGYDVSAQGSKLLVNPEEAERVQQIYQLYLQKRSLLPVVEVLAKRGWVNKAWTTRKGTVVGGSAFTRTSLHQLLTNVTYIGQLRYKDEIHKGEHSAIVDPWVFEQVRAMLMGNRISPAQRARSRPGALLRGLLRCRACNCSMCHTYTSRGVKRYRYYSCLHGKKQGVSTCLSAPLPALEVEQFVLEQIRSLDEDAAQRTAYRKALAQMPAFAPGESEEEWLVQTFVREVAYDARAKDLSVTLEPRGIFPMSFQQELEGVPQ